MRNSERLLAVFLLGLSLLPYPQAFAAGAAPGMDGVKDIIVEPILFNDPKAADACGLSRDALTDTVIKEMKADNLPASLAADAQPPMIGVARIDLVTQVYTINNDLDCTSWIEATALSKSNAIVPPIEVPRSVTVQYWHQGTMVYGAQSLHEHSINEVLQKMLHQFAKQYELDQPPAL